MKIYIAVFISLTFVVGICNGHTMSMGSCPKVEPVKDFSIDKFLGNWYAIQKVGTASSCITYNFTRDPLDNGKLKVIQTSLHFLLDSTGVEHVYVYTGNLEESPNHPGQMKVDFPLNPGKASFIIFNTDYKNYAGIFTCQKVWFSSTKSVTLLSRTPTLDKQTIIDLREQLESDGIIDPHTLSIVDQSDCDRLRSASRVISVDDKTFSAPNIGSGVQKVGQIIGNGVKDGGEYLGAGISKVGDWAGKFIKLFA